MAYSQMRLSEYFIISNLESQKEEECFNTVKPSVDKVSQEEVVSLWDVPSYLEQLLQVIVLSMDISTYLSMIHSKALYYSFVYGAL